MALTAPALRIAVLSTLLFFALSFVALGSPAVAAANSHRGIQATPLYETVTFSFEADDHYREAATGTSNSADPNPWTHRRLDVYLDHADLDRPLRVPGYFAGDGAGSSDGRVWRAHFTPTLEGQWIWFATFEKGHLLNAAPQSSAGTPLAITRDSGTFDVGPLNPNAPGFRSKGVLTWARGNHYYRFSERRAGRFVIAGVGSPENFLGYAGFNGVEDGSSANGQVCCCKQQCFNDCRQDTCSNAGDPASNFLHSYEAHVADWNAGDPDWSANGQSQQGRGIIGALNYLGDEAGVNSMYFLLMNLGGDGKDTYPFLTNGGGTDCPTSGSNFTPEHTLNYDVRRMDQWRTVFEHANNKGIMLQFLLAEQEACNIRWFGPHDSTGGPRNHMSHYRRLFMKQMVAQFGHLHGMRFNLCEENKSVSSCSSGSSSCGQAATPLTPQFTASELDQMARWIRSWDVLDHPIGVHTVPNDTTVYSDLLGLPQFPGWLSSTSMQIHGESGTGRQYGDYTQQAEHLFAQAGHRIPIINDEQGDPGSGLSSEFNSSASSRSTADDRRRRVLYDVLLSGGQISYYFGYYSSSRGGGDLRCDDFRTRDKALKEMSFARRVMEYAKIWTLDDRDSLLLGSTAEGRFGRPEVAADADGNRIVVYYSALMNGPTGNIRMGRLDLREWELNVYSAIWLDPVAQRVVGQRMDIHGGSIIDIPVPDLNRDGVPGNSVTEDTDLILLLQAHAPTPVN